MIATERGGSRGTGSQGNRTYKLGVATTVGTAAEEGSDFMAIAAPGHGTPTTPMRAGIIVEEESAEGIGAAADGNLRAFDQKFCRRTGEGSQQPIEAARNSHPLAVPVSESPGCPESSLPSTTLR